MESNLNKNNIPQCGIDILKIETEYFKDNDIINNEFITESASILDHNSKSLKCLRSTMDAIKESIQVINNL